MAGPTPKEPKGLSYTEIAKKRDTEIKGFKDKLEQGLGAHLDGTALTAGAPAAVPAATGAVAQALRPVYECIFSPKNNYLQYTLEQNLEPALKFFNTYDFSQLDAEEEAKALHLLDRELDRVEAQLKEHQVLQLKVFENARAKPLTSFDETQKKQYHNNIDLMEKQAKEQHAKDLTNFSHYKEHIKDNAKDALKQRGQRKKATQDAYGFVSPDHGGAAVGDMNIGSIKAGDFADSVNFEIHMDSGIGFSGIKDSGTFRLRGSGSNVISALLFLFSEKSIAEISGSTYTSIKIEGDSLRISGLKSSFWSPFDGLYSLLGYETTRETLFRKAFTLARAAGNTILYLPPGLEEGEYRGEMAYAATMAGMEVKDFEPNDTVITEAITRAKNKKDAERRADPNKTAAKLDDLQDVKKDDALRDAGRRLTALQTLCNPLSSANIIDPTAALNPSLISEFNQLYIDANGAEWSLRTPPATNKDLVECLGQMDAHLMVMYEEASAKDAEPGKGRIVLTAEEVTKYSDPNATAKQQEALKRYHQFTAIQKFMRTVEGHWYGAPLDATAKEKHEYFLKADAASQAVRLQAMLSSRDAAVKAEAEKWVDELIKNSETPGVEQTRLVNLLKQLASDEGLKEPKKAVLDKLIQKPDAWKTVADKLNSEASVMGRPSNAAKALKALYDHLSSDPAQMKKMYDIMSPAQKGAFRDAVINAHPDYDAKTKANVIAMAYEGDIAEQAKALAKVSQADLTAILNMLPIEKRQVLCAAAHKDRTLATLQTHIAAYLATKEANLEPHAIAAAGRPPASGMPLGMMARAAAAEPPLSTRVLQDILETDNPVLDDAAARNLCRAILNAKVPADLSEKEAALKAIVDAPDVFDRAAALNSLAPAPGAAPALI
ncbi:MAG: hypothetical protein K0R12_1182 [Gammaproteobacteria bacterium]|jgi:hypothetical protein|nr:hypothetical protein [Gammaproteobacteria bacterium]